MTVSKRMIRRALWALIALSAGATLLGVSALGWSWGSRAEGWSKRTVWIASHRRSGTHLSMDVLASTLRGPLRVVKLNHVSATVDEMSCDCVRYLGESGKVVHPYRDVRDVVISLYYYYNKFNHPLTRNMTLHDFVHNKRGARNEVIMHWAKTTVSWFLQGKAVLSVKYDDTVTGLPYVYDRLAKHVGTSVKSYDVDPRSVKSASGAVHRGAGKGESGWRTVLRKEESDRILELARVFSSEFATTNRSMICGFQPKPRVHAVRLWNELKYRYLRSFSTMYIGDPKLEQFAVPAFCPEIMKTAKIVYIPPT